MKCYFLKCKRDTENINPQVSNNSNGKITLLSKGLSSNLGIRTPLSKQEIQTIFI